MDIYREEILEHWQNPQNFGSMSDADLVAEEVNPLCGDEIKVYVRSDKRKIVDVSFTGSGCAISIASASILSEAVKNKPLKSISKISGDDMLKMLGSGSKSFPPARLKCAFLGLEAIKKVVGSK